MRRILTALAVLLVLLAGCASGPKLKTDERNEWFTLYMGRDTDNLTVTVRRGRGGGARKLSFSVWAGAELIQEWELDDACFGGYVIDDIDLDGREDLQYKLREDGGNAFYRCWLWDEDARQLVVFPEYETLPNASFDIELQVIRAWDAVDDLSGVESILRYVDGGLELIREIEYSVPETGADGIARQTVVVRDVVDGELIEVYRVEGRPAEGANDGLWSFSDPNNKAPAG